MITYVTSAVTDVVLTKWSIMIIMRMTERIIREGGVFMNDKLRTALCLVIAHAAAATVNFIFLLGTMQDPWLKWVFLAVTLLYLGVWVWFTAKTKRPAIATAMFTILLIISAFGAVVAYFSLLADWFIPVIILLWSPMAGIGAIIREDVLVWIAAALISAAMIVFSIVRMKKLREQN